MDDDRALSPQPKPRDAIASVGEHSGRRRIRSARSGGAPGKEDVGMSNDNAGVKPARRKPKVS